MAITFAGSLMSTTTRVRKIHNSIRHHLTTKINVIKKKWFWQMINQSKNEFYANVIKFNPPLPKNKQTNYILLISLKRKIKEKKKSNKKTLSLCQTYNLRDYINCMFILYIWINFSLFFEKKERNGFRAII